MKFKGADEDGTPASLPYTLITFNQRDEKGYLWRKERPLTAWIRPPTLTGMEVHFTPEIQARLDRLAAESGRAKDELVQDAMRGYLDELEWTRGMLDSRHDDLKSGKVKPIDGEEAFQRLMQKTAVQPNPKA